MEGLRLIVENALTWVWDDVRAYTGHLEQKTLVVDERGRFAEVSSDPRALGAAQAQRIDARGRVLLPGLMDAHIHAAMVGEA
jgi:predicted amidohydrolase YtcJ